jgi:twitching motility two-component system response regulator PilH
MEREILVVDADPGVRAALRGVLARGGHVALEAADGETGYAMARAQVPDLVIAEIYMPAGGWPCIVRAIKRDPVIGTLPVLVYTAHNGPEDVQWARSGGCDALLAKPACAEEVAREVRRLLELRHAPARHARALERDSSARARSGAVGGDLGDGSHGAMLV